MARSVVNVEHILQLKTEIGTYSNESDNTISVFRQQVSSFLDNFEQKLDMLEDEMEEKESELESCEWIHRNDEGSHCGSERSAYDRAYARYSECLSLVEEARNAIEEFDFKLEKFRITKSDLVSRASVGLDRVGAMINEYLLDSTSQVTGSPGSQNPILLNNNMSGVELKDSSEMPSAIHITGGDQIAYVLPRGSKTDPIVIDPEAMAHKFDNLPPVSKVDPQVLKKAAEGILVVLAAGGVYISLKDLFRQKADKLFEDKYGISTTELYIGTGNPKQEEYVKARNQIERDLYNEIKNIKREELNKKKKDLEENFKKMIEGEKQDSIESIEKVSRLSVEKKNLEIDFQSLEDGVERPHIPYEKKYVGGLTGKSLEYMMDQENMTPGRYVSMLLVLAQSNYSFEKQTGDFYTFVDGGKQLDIARDGSTIRVRNAVLPDCDTYVDVEIQGSLSQSQSTSVSRSLPFNSENPAKYQKEGVISTGKGVAVSAGGYCSVVGFSTEWFYLNEKGGVVSAGYNFQGLEGHLEGNLNIGSTMDHVSSDKNASGLKMLIGDNRAEVGGGVSIVKGEGAISASPRPLKFGNTFYQPGIKGSLGLNIGGSATGGWQISSKAIGAKAELSALLKISGSGHLRMLSLEDLPPEVARRLSDYNPTIMEMINDGIVEAGKIDLASSRIKP